MKEFDEWMKKRNGTSFRGYVITTYEQLCLAFGRPNSKGDGYKIDAEWVIDTPSGVATIYNYKDGHAYRGDEGLGVNEIYEWHVGGKDLESYKWVKKVLEEKAMDSMR